MNQFSSEKQEFVGNMFDTTFDFPEINKVIKLTGVSFENRQDLIPNLKEDTNVFLVRDRFNKFDKYAIKAVVKHDKEYVQIGWIPKALANTLSQEIDAGLKWKGKINKIIGQEYKNYGILVELEYLE